MTRMRNIRTPAWFKSCEVVVQHLMKPARRPGAFLGQLQLPAETVWSGVAVNWGGKRDESTLVCNAQLHALVAWR
jgi:hypothetical protein